MKNLSLLAVVVTAAMVLVGFDAFADEPASGGLLVHLNFDEASGEVAADASGSGTTAKLAGGPRWTTGKLGGGLEFDGVDDFVEIASTPDLDGLQNGSYTLSAWFKPAVAPPVRDGDQKAHYGILNKAGWHTGLRYNDDRTFVFDHFLQGKKDKEPIWSGASTGDETFAPGTWHHVAGVVDATARTATIFVDGVAKNSCPPWDATSRAREYGQMTWKVGMAAPGAKTYAYPAKGVVDDVRLYRRALTAQEITNLAKAASAAR